MRRRGLGRGGLLVRGGGGGIKVGVQTKGWEDGAAGRRWDCSETEEE